MLFRSHYVAGRVVGPYDISRSINVDVENGCSERGAHVTIDIRQRGQEKSGELSELVTDLKGLVGDVTRNQVVVEGDERVLP